MDLNATLVTPGAPATLDPTSSPFDLDLSTSQVLLGTVLFGLASILVLLWPRKAANLPPGPKPGFLVRSARRRRRMENSLRRVAQVGNRNQAPKSKPWRWFRDLNQQYGA
jgi:hypothetical protein